MGEIERWFSYSEDDGFRRHASAEEARACAASALDADTDASGDGWSEETGSTCWGEVREAAVETIVHKHGPDCRPDDEDADSLPDCSDDFDLRFDYISRFDLTPMAPDSRLDAATARAEAAEQRAEALEREVARLRADRAVLMAAGLVGSNAGRTLPSNCLPMLVRLSAEVVAIVGSDDREALGAYVEALLLAEAHAAGEVSDG